MQDITVVMTAKAYILKPHVPPAQPLNTGSATQISACPVPSAGDDDSSDAFCTGHCFLCCQAVLSIASAAPSGVRVESSAGLQLSVASEARPRPAAITEANQYGPLPAYLGSGLKPTVKRAYKRALREPQGSESPNIVDDNSQHSSWMLFVRRGELLPAKPSSTDRPTAQAQPGNLRLLSWNCGGLHRARHAELTTWLAEAPVDVLPTILCCSETHWSQASEHTACTGSRKWHALHSGSGTSAGGLLVLISSHVCAAADIQLKEIAPGRLLHIRINLSGRPAIDLLACYQHACNPGRQDLKLQCTTEDLLHALVQQRLALWQSIESWIRSVPARNLLRIAGDLNVSLLHSDSQHVGKFLPCTEKAPAQTDSHLAQTLLRRHKLTVLNTWRKGGPASATFVQNGQPATQIDFIIMRIQQPDPLSKQPRPCTRLPFVPTTGMYHLPVQARIPCSNRPALRHRQDLLLRYQQALPTTVSTPDELQQAMHSAWKQALADTPTPATSSQAGLVPKLPLATADCQAPTITQQVRRLWQLRQDSKALRPLAGHPDAFHNVCKASSRPSVS